MLREKAVASREQAKCELVTGNNEELHAPAGAPPQSRAEARRDSTTPKMADCRLSNRYASIRNGEDAGTGTNCSRNDRVSVSMARIFSLATRDVISRVAISLRLRRLISHHQCSSGQKRRDDRRLCTKQDDLR